FKPRKQLIAQIQDESGSVLNLRFIHFYPNHQKQLAQGQTVRALGEIKRGYYGDEMIHPKIKSPEKSDLAQSLTPIYPTTNGLNQPTLRKVVQTALETVDLSEILPDNYLKKYQLIPLAQSLRTLHNPPPDWSLSMLTNGALPEWRRLKFDELLAQQLSMRLARQRRRAGNARALVSTGKLSKKLLSYLPFDLTNAQKKVCAEIREDLAKPVPMHRLLQGDVGSGKTIVAALSALVALESDGVQVAIMAPTEILAEQHFIKFKQWFEPLGISVAWLSGSLKK
ncbi:DEAD/DEAH box helicase, partial [Kingella kingae]|nr:DEAD/DEAH box helicase [Kingella kingae]